MKSLLWMVHDFIRSEFTTSCIQISYNCRHPCLWVTAVTLYHKSREQFLCGLPEPAQPLYFNWHVIAPFRCITWEVFDSVEEVLPAEATDCKQSIFQHCDAHIGTRNTELWAIGPGICGRIINLHGCQWRGSITSPNHVQFIWNGNYQRLFNWASKIRTEVPFTNMY